MNESEFNAPDLVAPLHTFYTVESDFNFINHTCGEMASVCYPTVAPSSLRLYKSDGIPGWENKLLMTTLKAGKIFQIELNDNGTAWQVTPLNFSARRTDIAMSPLVLMAVRMYVITDVSGPVQALKSGPITPTTDLWSPGSVLVFKYVGVDSAKQ